MLYGRMDIFTRTNELILAVLGVAESGIVLLSLAFIRPTFRLAYLRSSLYERIRTQADLRGF